MLKCLDLVSYKSKYQISHLGKIIQLLREEKLQTIYLHEHNGLCIHLKVLYIWRLFYFWVILFV